MLLANCAADLKAAHIWQHHVENGQINVFLFDAAQCAGAVAAERDAKVAVAQIHCEQFGQFCFVVNNENVFIHRGAPSSLNTCSVP